MDKTVGHTPLPWRTSQMKGWGDDWCIHAEGYGPRPLAKTIKHPDVYYRQVSRNIRGEDVITFASPTDAGEAQKFARLREEEANAALIVERVNKGPAADAMAEALALYVTACGNTAASVDRELIQLAWEKARKALSDYRGEQS